MQRHGIMAKPYPAYRKHIASFLYASTITATRCAEYWQDLQVRLPQPALILKQQRGGGQATMVARDSILNLQKLVGETVLGQAAMIERLTIGLLANGHLLVEGLPGL